MKRLLTASILIFTLMAMPARSQRYGGGASTVQGDYLRGIGIEAWGMGLYNLNTAQGEAILVDASIRANTYINGVLRAGRDNWVKLDRIHEEKMKEAYENNRARIRDNPEALDIFTGNALNMALDEMNNRAISPSAFRSIPVPIAPEMIRMIPFKLDEKNLIFSIQRMKIRGKGKLPVAFQDARFAKELKAYNRVIDNAIDQMIDGEMPESTLTEYRMAVSGLSNKLESEFGQVNSGYYREAKNLVNELANNAKLLESLKIQKVMAELDHYTGKTVDDLRKFMEKHNLRFAGVDQPEERSMYVELYTALDQVRKEVAIKPDRGRNK